MEKKNMFENVDINTMPRIYENAPSAVTASADNKYILEGIFTEFDIENRNGRVYKQKEFMRHFKALKEEISKGSCLGELDHPKEFATSLNTASHQIIDIWLDEANNCVRGKIKLLTTSAGKNARALVDDGINLHISSRAAGTVTEDKSVRIHKLFTYDLVATPGFANAKLTGVNEGIDEDGLTI